MAETNEVKTFNWNVSAPGCIMILILSAIIGILAGLCVSQRSTIDSLYTMADSSLDYVEQANEDIKFLNDYIDAQAENIELKEQKIEVLEQQIDALSGTDSDDVPVVELPELYSASL